MNRTEEKSKLRKGTAVILMLGLLTAVEFWVATSLGSGVFAALSAIALVKAWLIIEYFMHLSKLWKAEEE